jgi:hypothetical protein
MWLLYAAGGLGLSVFTMAVLWAKTERREAAQLGTLGATLALISSITLSMPLIAFTLSIAAGFLISVLFNLRGSLKRHAGSAVIRLAIGSALSLVATEIADELRWREAVRVTVPVFVVLMVCFNAAFVWMLIKTARSARSRAA